MYPLIDESERVVLPPTLGILEGILPGVVLVDDRHAPTCAAVIRQNLRNVSARLLGNPSKDLFNAGLVEYIQRESNLQEDVTGKNLYIATATKAWEDVIYRAVGYRVLRVGRTQFEFNAVDFEERASDVAAPNLEGLVIRRIDGEFIAANAPWTQYTNAIWNGAENYLRHGGGWVALFDNLIVGSCDAAFVGGNSAELNIKVEKSQRGRGLGIYLAVQFIRDCIDRGLTPNWTCDTENVASYQMAQKLGFRPMRAYFAYSTQNWAKSHEPARTSV